MFAHTRPKLLAFATTCMLISSPSGAESVAVVDFAKAKATSENCVSFLRRHDSVGAVNTQGAKINSLFSKTAEKTFATRDTDFIVRKGDVFTISLLQGLVKDFKEATFFNKKNGDIAIVANVQERKTGTDYNFKAGSEQEGRVVFFQRNVEAGAPLNLANLPVYGPSEYEGNPLMISLYIIEIDATDNKEIGGIIDSLANLSKTVTPANSAAISVLNSLGSTLLKFNKNDLVAEYRVELDPGAGEHPVIRNVVLEYGNYAFYSKQNASEWHTFDGLRYRQDNGRIYSVEKNKEGTPTENCTVPFKDETWLTLQVNKAKQVANLPTSNTLANLIAQLESSSTTNDDLNKITQTIIASKENGAEFERYKNILHAIQSKIAKDANYDFRIDASFKAELSKMIDNVFKSDSTFSRTQKERIIEDLRMIDKDNPFISAIDKAADIKNRLNI